MQDHRRPRRERASLLARAPVPRVCALAVSLACSVAMIAPAAAQSPEGDSNTRWGLAPVRWGGSLAASYLQRELHGQGASRQTVELLDLNAATYLWQPWFMQIAGGLGLLLAQQRDDSGDGTTHAGSRGSTGRLEMAVFPISRFPFTANLDVTDSRANGDIIGADYRSTRLGLRQNYRNVGGDSAYSMSYDRSLLQSEVFGADRVDAVNGTANYAWGSHRLQLAANVTDNQRSSDDLGARYQRASLLHNWRATGLAGGALSVDSLASTHRDERRVAAGELGRTRFGLREVSSFLNWTGDGELPLVAVASARLTDAGTQTAAGQNEARSGALNGSLNYRFNRNLSAFGALGASTFDTDGARSTVATQAAGTQYQFDPRRWGDAIYTAQTGATLANASRSGDGGADGSADSGARAAALQAGHQIAHSVPWGTQASWSLSFGQSVTAINDTEAGNSRSWINTASSSWRYAGTSGLAGYGGVTLGDARSVGRNAGVFQLVNAQLSGQFRSGVFSAWNANLTWQLTRQRLELDEATRTQRSLSGSAAYQHGRIFGVPQLVYVAQFNAYADAFDRRLAGDVNATRDLVTWSFEQRLEWMVGRLEARTALRIAQIDGKKNASLVASVRRRFGGL